jgi:hypothetical protein
MYLQFAQYRDADRPGCMDYLPSRSLSVADSRENTAFPGRVKLGDPKASASLEAPPWEHLPGSADFQSARHASGKTLL